MSDASLTAPRWQRLQLGALVLGLVGLGGCALAGMSDRTQVFRSYLPAYLFFLGIGLGSLALLMVHHLTGGAWGWTIRGVAEAAAGTLWLLALLFLPLVMGLTDLYPWARWNPEEIEHSGILRQKSLYLNATGFQLRAVVYFVVWLGLAFLLSPGHAAATTRDERDEDRQRAMSAPGLILLALTVTFASVDWVMSLEPMWYSTIFGLLFAVSQALSAMAFAVGMLLLLSTPTDLQGAVSRSQFRDLGNLLLTLVMLWAYMAFSQYLLIWSGDLPEETPYYVKRLLGGWQGIALLLIVLHFVLPFLLLLSRDVKQSLRTLGLVAALLLLMRFLDLFWMIAPAFRPYEGIQVHWLDPLALLGVGGVWLALFLQLLRRRPLVLRPVGVETEASHEH